MADYWKSLGRHYCDACKCWFGDNKASIEFHEGGKRHQHNVEKQLRDARLKSAKNDKEKLETEATLQQIEQAALSAYLKDVDGKTTEASVEKIAAAQSQRSLPAAPTVDPELQKAAAQLQKIREKQEISQRAAHFLKQKKAEAVVAPPPPPPVPASLWPWQQSYTPEGYIYYYNTQTGVTQWEPPSAGKPSTTPPTPPSSSSVVTVGTKRPAGSDGETITEPPPPAKRHAGPYGSWTVTDTYTREEESDSSQQQPQEGDVVGGSSSTDKEQDGGSSDEGSEGEEGGGDRKKKKRRTGLKFAEKTLGSDALAGEEERSETAAFKGFTFKKRSAPRTHNIKQRTSDW